MDSAQWNQFQEFNSDGVTSGTPCTPLRPAARPPKDQTLNCPRCHSTNTKFCYYNNYSLTQPRYLCKTCRRYWTAGGSLRNVPVGGGSRKHNKKYISTTPNDHINSPSHVLPHHQNPKIHDQGQDLNLASELPHFLKFAKIKGKDVIPSSSSSSLSTTSSTANATHLSEINFMRSGNNISADRGPYNTFVPNIVPISSSSSSLSHHRQTNYALFPPPGFPFRECKPSLTSFDGSRYTNSNGPERDLNGTLMFTLGTTKRHSSTGEGGDHNHQDKGTLENKSNGFWTGMLGGGSW